MSDSGISIEISDSDSVIELSSDSDDQAEPITESSAVSDGIVFIDLTSDEIVEVVEHTRPKATVDELARISEQFVLHTDSNVLNHSNVTIRKRFCISHVERAESPSDFVQTNSVEADVNFFLESLDDKVPLERAHPESVKFRKTFKRHRNELVERLKRMYNERIFGNMLCHIPLIWTKWIGTMGGCCRWWRQGHVTIMLSELLLTTADRIRDVLLHEMCHAAVWIIDKHNEKELDGHGKLWQSWGKLAKNTFPRIPLVERFHNSLAKSKIKSKNIFCALCHGPVEVFRIKIRNGRRVTIALRKPGSFALFVKENYKLVKKPEIDHAGVMKILSEQFSQLSAEQKRKYRQSFGVLK